MCERKKPHTTSPSLPALSLLSNKHLWGHAISCIFTITTLTSVAYRSAAAILGELLDFVSFYKRTQSQTVIYVAERWVQHSGDVMGKEWVVGCIYSLVEGRSGGRPTLLHHVDYLCYC